MYIKALTKVTDRYAPSRLLSFDAVHVFKALQIIESNGHTSRATLCKELSVGEGVIKTLIKHMKMQGLVKTSNGGTKMTQKGTGICSGILSAIPSETPVPRCSIATGKFNYAVLIKNLDYAIKSGIEQRDAAIRKGASGATTILFKDGKFVMPGETYDSLKNEQQIRNMFLEKLSPEDGDVLIIVGAEDKTTAELAAKGAALLTIVNHEKHD